MEVTRDFMLLQRLLLTSKAETTEPVASSDLLVCAVLPEQANLINFSFYDKIIVY